MPDVFEYSSSATADEIAALLRRAKSICITTHQKPDGDAMGAALALSRALRSLGKRTEIYLFGQIENTLRTLIEDDPVHMDRQPPEDPSAFDLIAVADTGSWNQLEPVSRWLKARRERIIILDHHTRGDDVSDRRLVDAGAASTTMVLLDVLDELGCDMTDGGRGGVAEALFVGVATDTGWFRYSNANERAFSMAARLLATGVDKNRLYQQLEESYSPKRLVLEAIALQSVQYARRGTVAILTLRPEDFRNAGAAAGEMTGMVNLPMHVKAVRVSIMLTEQEPGVTKISFRSKPSAGDDDSAEVIDVNALAQQFGGGGHVHAAGARLKCSIDDARDKVLAAIESMD
jgi:phosphoesterase RecJ-like protein